MASIKSVPESVNFDAVVGDTWGITLKFRDPDTHDPLDVTLWTFESAVTQKDGSSYDVDVSMTSAATGQVGFSLSATETEEIGAGIHTIYIRKTEAGVTQTILRGSYSLVNP